MGSLHIVPIDAIDWEQARACLQGIQDQHGVYTAHRTKFLMRKIFTYARENCVRSLVNPVADSDTWLEDKPRAKHHAAIVDPVEFRKLVTEVSLCGLYDADRVCSPNVGNALRLLLHTVVRQGELRGARWGEFKGDLWEIPAARMKMKEAHIVPLTAGALGVLESQRAAWGGRTGPDDLVFPGAQNAAPGRSMGSQAMTDALNAMGFEGRQTPHGLRTCFATFAREAGKDDALIERCLAHADANQVRAAYNRAERMDARRELMEWWSLQLV
jgi:integrase